MFGLFGNKSVDVSMQIEPQQDAYLPGDSIEVAIGLDAAKAGKFREIRAGLVRVERYQVIDVRHDSDGDDTQTKVWRVDERWVQKEVLAGSGATTSEGQTRFRWQIPADATPSFDGKAAQVRWLVKLTIDRKLAKDTNEEAELIVASAPSASQLVGGEGLLQSEGAADLRLSFDGREFNEGATLRGRLQVEPRQSFDVRGVRLELVRHETVMAGDRINRQDVVAQTVSLAAKTSFQAGASASYDWEITLPGEGCPSYETNLSKASWSVRAVLDRALKSDLNVAESIRVIRQS